MNLDGVGKRFGPHKSDLKRSYFLISTYFLFTFLLLGFKFCGCWEVSFPPFTSI